jgi:pimeloyl-ACP methyl ester carboxylesterase
MTKTAQRCLVTLAIAATLAASPRSPSSDDTRGTATKPRIVLVHGAFADGSSWQHLIPILERDGYSVIAVQNPMTSFAEDVATTRRAIEGQSGPVVVVGHSYGGAVMTAAAAGNRSVTALVYISAFAPDAEEPIGAFLADFPTPLATALRPDAAGLLSIDVARFHEVFCKDVSAAEAGVMALTQKALAGTAFEATLASPAWKSIPSWYIVGTEDQAISPDLERFYAKRMGATTIEIAASHVSFISHPREVADVIETAAGGRSGRSLHDHNEYGRIDR